MGGGICQTTLIFIDQMPTEDLEGNTICGTDNPSLAFSPVVLCSFSAASRLLSSGTQEKGFPVAPPNSRQKSSPNAQESKEIRLTGMSQAISPAGLGSST